MLPSPQLSIIIKFLTMLDGIRIDAQGTVRFREQSGSPVHSFVERTTSFEEEAKEEIKSLNPTSTVLNLYKSDGLVFCAKKPDEALKLALTPQDYVCSMYIKKVRACTQCGVFYKCGTKYKMLWRNGRYSENRKPVFLNPAQLQRELKKVFTKHALTLGILEERSIKYIAWRIDTEQGTFFIPWHNGCLIAKDKEWNFVEKEFKDMRSTYKVLRFSYAQDNRKEYRIVCG